MSKKENQNNKNYNIEEGEVLVGSSLLRKKNIINDRVSYMLNNMELNKAYLFEKEKRKSDGPELLNDFKKNKYLDKLNREKDLAFLFAKKFSRFLFLFFLSVYFKENKKGTI